MEIFEYYASFRAEILEVVTGVENSRGSLFWDNTTPNWVTKNRLKKIYDKYLQGATDFGLYIVTRHTSCPNPKHPEYPEYPTSNAYGLDISYLDENYIWNDGQMFQGNRNCICPCSSENTSSDHWVIDDVVYKKGADVRLCEKLEDVLGDVYASIKSAGEKKPRSAIRESLLRAVLRLNDELLPEPMDSYIDRNLGKNT